MSTGVISTRIVLSKIEVRIYYSESVDYAVGVFSRLSRASPTGNLAGIRI